MLLKVIFVIVLFVVLIILWMVFRMWWVCVFGLLVNSMLLCWLKVSVLEIYIILLVSVLGMKGVSGVLLLVGIIMDFGIVKFFKWYE